MGEKGIDLFELVAHGCTHAPGVIHNPKALQKGVWSIVGQGMVLDAIVRQRGLDIGARGFCAFEQGPAFFGDANVEVFAAGLHMDLREGQGQYVSERGIRLGYRDVFRDVLRLAKPHDLEVGRVFDFNRTNRDLAPSCAPTRMAEGQLEKGLCV